MAFSVISLLCCHFGNGELLFYPRPDNPGKKEVPQDWEEAG